MHYTALIDRYKGDIAHTWQVLNDITGKRRKKVNFVILLTLIVYRLMMPIQSVMHFVITLLILVSNVPQRLDKLQLVLVTIWKEIIKILSS